MDKKKYWGKIQAKVPLRAQNICLVLKSTSYYALKSVILRRFLKNKKQKKQVSYKDEDSEWVSDEWWRDSKRRGSLTGNCHFLSITASDYFRWEGRAQMTLFPWKWFFPPSNRERERVCVCVCVCVCSDLKCKETTIGNSPLFILVHFISPCVTFASLLTLWYSGH